MVVAREAAMAERTRPGQVRRMRGREFLKSGGVEELWPKGVVVGRIAANLDCQSTTSGDPRN